jgi:hypothetical protein
MYEYPIKSLLYLWFSNWLCDIYWQWSRVLLNSCLIIEQILCIQLTSSFFLERTNKLKVSRPISIQNSLFHLPPTNDLPGLITSKWEIFVQISNWDLTLYPNKPHGISPLLGATHPTTTPDQPLAPPADRSDVPPRPLRGLATGEVYGTSVRLFSRVFSPV